MRISGFLTAIIFFMFWSPVLAQVNPVPVERSDEKVIIEGRVYYIHIVKPGQTLYSISKAYHVSEKTISEENPVLVTGLKAGQVLKIPFVRSEEQPPVLKDTEHYYYHTVAAGETLYSLSKKYNVTVDEILESNPGLHVDDVPVGAEIKIPKHKVAPSRMTFESEQPKVRYHRVKPGETLYSIARLYDLSVRDIRKINKGIRNQIKPGEFIRIPVSSRAKEEPPVQPQGYIAGHRETNIPCDSVDIKNYRYSGGRIVMMLPLYLDENKERFYIDSSEVNPETGKKIRKVIYRDPNWIYPRSRTFLEFYEGAILAVDDLNRSGISLELDVVDTRQDPAHLDSLIQAGILQDADLIIGPVYPTNLSLVADYARKNRIPVVSPLSRNDDFLRFNPWAIQIRPSKSLEHKVMAGFLGQNYQDNIVLVHSLDSAQRSEISRIKAYLNESLSEYTWPEDVSVKEVYLPEVISPRDTVNTLQLALKKDQKNTVWIVSDKESFVSEIVSRLNTMANDYDIRLYGNSSWLYFMNIQPDYFFNLKLKLFTPRMIDYTDSLEIRFVKNFRQKYATDPDIYSLAWDGYDVTKYFLTAWSLFGSQLPECIPAWHPPLTTASYFFQRTGWFSGLINTRFYLVNYDEGFVIHAEPWEEVTTTTEPNP